VPHIQLRLSVGLLRLSPEKCPQSGCRRVGHRTLELHQLVLDALAQTEGTSKQEVIRRAVLERYERSGHASRVASSAKRMTDRWGDVLERLGTA